MKDYSLLGARLSIWEVLMTASSSRQLRLGARAAEAAKFDLVFMVDSPFITPDTAPQRAAAGG